MGVLPASAHPAGWRVPLLPGTGPQLASFSLVLITDVEGTDI